MVWNTFHPPGLKQLYVIPAVKRGMNASFYRCRQGGNVISYYYNKGTISFDIPSVVWVDIKDT